jgi:hypothetical protein
MTSKWHLAFVAALLAAGSGCGNYSNEDVDFQLALPEQGDMEAKLQVSLSRTDSAEYYRDTRTAVLSFNKLVLDLVLLVDTVRGYTPTSRNGNQRTWGPWPDDKHPGWETRVVMQRSTVSETFLHMDYWVQLRQVGQDDSGWVSLLVGDYTSQGSARTGLGHVHFDVQAARVARYPVNSDPGLADLDHLDVCYNRSGDASACDNSTGAAVKVTMDIVKVEGANPQSAKYVYQQAQDASGSMQFDWQGKTDNGLPIIATMNSRWLASGDGRADLTADLTPNLPAQTPLGTDCWGPDTVASYSVRKFRTATDPPEVGTPDLCVFPPP